MPESASSARGRTSHGVATPWRRQGRRVIVTIGAQVVGRRQRAADGPDRSSWPATAPDCQRCGFGIHRPRQAGVPVAAQCDGANRRSVGPIEQGPAAASRIGGSVGVERGGVATAATGLGRARHWERVHAEKAIDGGSQLRMAWSRAEKTAANFRPQAGRDRSCRRAVPARLVGRLLAPRCQCGLQRAAVLDRHVDRQPAHSAPLRRLLGHRAAWADNDRSTLV